MAGGKDRIHRGVSFCHDPTTFQQRQCLLVLDAIENCSTLGRRCQVCPAPSPIPYGICVEMKEESPQCLGMLGRTSPFRAGARDGPTFIRRVA